MHVCLYLHNTLENYLDYHILDVLGHGSKCLDIMGLDHLGLDILGIIRMCNTAYNLKAVFSSLVFIITTFGRPFAVTACTHSNISLSVNKLAGSVAMLPQKNF